MRAGGASTPKRVANGAEHVHNLFSEEYMAEIERDGVRS